jgi:hypothetical protein
MYRERLLLDTAVAIANCLILLSSIDKRVAARIACLFLLAVVMLRVLPALEMPITTHSKACIAVTASDNTKHDERRP